MLSVVDPNTGITTFGPETGEALADYDDLDDFDSANFSPPIDTHRNNLNNFATFSQQVIIENVNPSDFEAVVANHSTNFVRVTAKVFQGSTEIISASWLRARYEE